MSDTRHFYRHRVTGVVAPLNDAFAAVFGDRFERVGTPTHEEQTPDDQTPEMPKTEEVKAPATKSEATPAPAADTTTVDAPKEGDK